MLEYFSSKKERKKGRKETMKMICAIDDVSPIHLFGLFVLLFGTIEEKRHTYKIHHHHTISQREYLRAST